MIAAWRIVKVENADDIFGGEGARRFGGRWNKIGHRVAYTASSVSLATLELLVTTPRAQLLSAFVITSCTFPEVLVDEVDETLLPPNWRNYPAAPELQQIGTAWLLGGSSAVLSVPSAVTPEERNYLINPEHEHFRSIDIGPSRPFQIDLRLLT